MTTGKKKIIGTGRTLPFVTRNKTVVSGFLSVVESNLGGMQSARVKLPEGTLGVLVIGYWLLVIGYWLLVIGYWLLVIGYWLLLLLLLLFLLFVVFRMDFVLASDLEASASLWAR
jgi:hypothetical protein